MPGAHASEDALERYCLGLVPAAELETLESHLLACTACQDRLREAEAYVRTVQQAAAQAAADQLVRRSRWGMTAKGLFRAIPMAAIAGAAALVLIWNFAPSFRPAPAPPPLAVSLDLTRGDEDPRANAPAGRPLLLALDVTGLAPLDSYHVRVVDARGAAMVDAVAKPDHGRLTVATPIRLARGTYWVRVYNPPEPLTPLREYGLQIE